MKVNLESALNSLKYGKVIAYPTETTFGLGCDAFNEQALERLCQIKHRDANKGFIVLINKLEQLEQLVVPLPADKLAYLAKVWPAAITFTMPARASLPKSLTGEHNSIAIRMSSHPIANALCRSNPITSTSANYSGEPVLTDADEIVKRFGSAIAGVIAEPPGEQPPSQIINLLTGERYR